MATVTPTAGAFLRIIYQLREDGIPVRRARISERLGLSRPTVTQTVNRMVGSGLVQFGTGRYRNLELTELGEREAIVLVRRHRLAERLLTDVLHLSAHQAHLQAAKWDTLIDAATEQAIIERLDDPRRSPWGNPVPGLDELGIDVGGEGQREPVCLTHLGPPGSTVRATVHSISEEAQDDAELASGLVRAGIVPGAAVDVSITDEDYQLVGLTRFDIPATLGHVIKIDVAPGE
ncbi:metal-dependent transcriptional regulator [Gordonia sp. VNK21]|uniref:metal-dependent transcriptional regulator n=1 Tax=Gordonia sp. VNK21 TaxID=3382483 RepID=UPI0038D41C3A